MVPSSWHRSLHAIRPQPSGMGREEKKHQQAFNEKRAANNKLVKFSTGGGDSTLAEAKPPKDEKHPSEL